MKARSTRQQTADPTINFIHENSTRFVCPPSPSLPARTHQSGIAAHEVALGDVIWLQHVSVIGQREVREDFAPSVLLQAGGAELVVRPLLHPLHPPRVEGVGGFLDIREITAGCFVFRGRQTDALRDGTMRCG